MKGVFVLLCLFPGLLLSAKTPAPLDSAPVLRIDGIQTNGWFRFGIERARGLEYSVQTSKDLKVWKEIARIHGREVDTNRLSFIDPTPGFVAYYRLQASDISFDSDWRNQVFALNDPFLADPVSGSGQEVRWVKFAILTNEPGRVYFQNSWKYKFHYNFAVTRLPAFKGMTPAQFDAASLRTNNQQVVLGTVFFGPQPERLEAGIQFVGQDAYAPEEVAQWFEWVKAGIQPLELVKTLYIPSYEQATTAAANREFFARRGIDVADLSYWDNGQNSYSTGWAIGRLKFVPASQLAEAYANGVLRPDDILLTDAVPAEIPYVSGIISLSPSTPNSHVALLARSYGVPFVYLADSEMRGQAQTLDGKTVVLSAYQGFPSADIRLLDVSAVDAGLREELADIKKPGLVNITPKEHVGAYIVPAENLVPEDIRYFGGKASNFGFLRRQVPSNSPPALAISFDLWDEFLDQKLGGGQTLREQITSRLKKYSDYPPDAHQLASDLQAIRNLIEDDTQFTLAQQQAIAAALLGRFETNRKIRFRSSTNVEDREEFVGAGLYESHSGCLADDLDSDTAGPSACDSNEPKERGVFRAIRKVYASFYNDNAVLERMRHGVDEAKVGMAILVHYSNPDEDEQANGVATVTYDRSQGRRSFVAKMVTQKGAVSVTNPEGSALPEVMNVSQYFITPYAAVQQYSTLMPLGATVLGADAEYFKFTALFARVADAFEAYYPGKTNYILDFEYKKIVPGTFLLKQVRELPTGKPDAPHVYLLNAPDDWCVFQGEYGNVFANHRLKAKLHLQTRDLRLATNTLRESFWGPISVEYLDGDTTAILAGLPSAFPGAGHTVGTADYFGTAVTDRWQIGTASGIRSVALQSQVPTEVNANQSPLITLRDLEVQWAATYSTPLPAIEFGQARMVTNETVRLRPCVQTNVQSVLVTRTVPASAGAAVSISFFWPERPAGNSAGYTAPLVAWKETRIEGLTTEPIVLQGYFSQTYRPEHHNFSETFLFEPAVEPGMSPQILAELEAKSIRYIYVYWGGLDSESSIYVADRDWKLRPLDPNAP